jgi:hypothetical protein
VRVSRAGIDVGGRALPWPEIADVDESQGQVVVRRKPAGRFAVVEVASLPDVDVLIAPAKWVPKRLVTYR